MTLKDKLNSAKNKAISTGKKQMNQSNGTSHSTGQTRSNNGLKGKATSLMKNFKK